MPGNSIHVDDNLVMTFEGDEPVRARLTAHEALRIAELLIRKARRFTPWAGDPASAFCEAASRAALGDLQDVITIVEGHDI